MLRFFLLIFVTNGNPTEQLTNLSGSSHRRWPEGLQYIPGRHTFVSVYKLRNCMLISKCPLKYNCTFYWCSFGRQSWILGHVLFSFLPISLMPRHIYDLAFLFTTLKRTYISFGNSNDIESFLSDR